MDNQFLEEIDEITYTIEFLVDQLHEALEREITWKVKHLPRESANNQKQFNDLFFIFYPHCTL